MGQRFSYVKYDQKHTELQEAFKAKFEYLEAMVDDQLANGRAKAFVHTKLEEAYMWIGKAIRDDQIASGGDAAHIAERTEV